MTQFEKAKLFKSLHVKGNPLMLVNIWDAGTAKAVAETGAKAIATGSWAVAAAHGFGDGEQIPLNLVLANIERVVKSVDLPVSIDLESGYGQTLTDVQESIAKVIEAGAVGINLEDQIIKGEGVYSVKEQCARIKAMRERVDELGIPLFINARTDIVFKTDPALRNEELLATVIERAHAYHQAGADGFFPFGLQDAAQIERLCKESPIPINIVMMSTTKLSPKELASLGVARISYGPGPYRQMLEALKTLGREALLLS